MITFVRRMTGQLVVLSWNGDEQMWNRRVLRKDTTCHNCRRSLPKGVSAWGTVTGTQMYRKARLCKTCVTGMAGHEGEIV